MSKTFEVQDPWDQSRAKNVELEGLSVTIRGLGRRGEKKRWISNPRPSGGGDAEWRRRRRSAWLGVGRVWLYQDGRGGKDMGPRMAGGIIELKRYGDAVGKEKAGSQSQKS